MDNILKTNNPNIQTSDFQQHSTKTSSQEISLLDKVFLSFTVSLTGAAVMMIELLGTRIIGPYFGASLIVWSALISVALLALAIGYYSGGIIADREGKIQLSHVILAAALLTGIIPVVSEPVQAAAGTLGLRFGALTSALTLFTLPLILLGMTGPFVIKIAASRLEGIGTTSGSVYAVSTIGSVLGTLILGFYLLPIAGTRNIIIAVSLTLVFLSLCFACYEHTRLRILKSPILWCIAGILSATLIIISGTYNSSKQYRDFKVISEVESHYGWVRVVDQPKENIRWLLSDSSSIGLENLGTGKSMLAYQTIVKQIPRFYSIGTDALLIGLGSGHLDASLQQHGITTDSIEIDPMVAEAAIEYFNFKPSGKLIVGDARYHIQQLDKQYDFIIHDCFTGGSEPIHLLSKEMLTAIKARMKKTGILALNFVGFSRGPNKHALEAVSRTIDEVFAYKRVFVPTPGNNFNDFVFFASNKPLQLSAAREDQKIARWLRMHEVLVPADKSFVITDDFNPLEGMQLAKAEQYREIFLERMGEEILFW